jgi:WD40 repeat protein
VSYDVFISYSQDGDARVAEAVRDALTRFAKPWWRRRALRVFLDRSVLSANPGMWSSISTALDESDWLILLASPESARSEWVNRELSHWLADRGTDRLIVAVTAGRCQWDDDAGGFDRTSDAIPDALRGLHREEPRHVDLSWAREDPHLDLQNARFREQITEMAAPPRGRSREDLDGIDLREHRRTRRSIGVVAITFAVLFAVSAIAGLVAVRQTRVARARTSDSDFERLESQSSDVVASDPSLGLLLAVEARKLRDNATSRSELLSDLQAERGFLGEVSTEAQPVDVALLNDGTAIYTTDHASLGFVGLHSGKALGSLLALGAPTRERSVVRIAADPGRSDTSPIVVARLDTGQVWRIDPRSDRPTGPPIDVGAPVFAVASSQRLGLIAVGRVGGAVEILRNDGTVVRTVPPPTDAPADPYLVPSGVADAYYGAGDARMTASDVEALAFSPATSELAIERIGGVDRVDLSTGGVTSVPLGQPPSYPPSLDESLAYSPDGNELLASEPTSLAENSGQGLQQLQALDLTTGATLWTHVTATGLSLFSDDGSAVYVVDSASNVVAVDARTGTVLRTVFVPHGAIDGVAIEGGSGNIVLASETAAHLTVVSPTGASPIVRTFGAPGQSPDGFSPDGRSLLVEAGASVPFTFSLWDPVTARPIVPAIPSVALGALGRDDTMTAIFNNATAGTVDLHSLRDVGPVIPLDVNGLYSDAASPDGNLLVLGRFDGTVQVYHHEDGRPDVLHLGGPVNQVAVSSQGVLALQVLGEQASLYRLPSGVRVAAIGQVSALAFGTSGKVLVVGSPSGRLKLVDSSTGAVVGPSFPRIPVGIDGAQWSAEYIGSMDFSGEVRLFDPSTGQQIGGNFPGIVDDTGAWSLNPAGTLLDIETRQGVDQWDLNPGDWQTAACQLAGRNLTQQEWQTYLANTGPYARTCPQWPAGTGR